MKLKIFSGILCCMEKEEFKNEAADLENGQEGSEVFAQEEPLEVGENADRKIFHSARKHLSVWKQTAKAVFVFCIFVVLLGGIAFGVVWVVENEQSLPFLRREKPGVDDVVKVIDKTVVSGGETSSSSQSSEGSSEQSSSNGKNVAQQGALADFGKISVLVLNGGGASGAAGKAAELLRKEGYTLAKSGNASVFTYSGISVFYREESRKEDAEKMGEVLRKTYSSVVVVKANTADEKKEEIVVVIGG